MDISKDFYKSEVIDGFYVPSIMKRSWVAMLDVLETVAEICEKHDIKWWIDFGTLLGYIRHGGFIPWDDDLDIAMLREDYMKFIEVADSELPAGYRSIHFYNCNETENYLIRVINSEGVSIDAGYLDRYHGFPYAVGIDIFAYDYINQDDEAEEAVKTDIAKLEEIAGQCGFFDIYDKDTDFFPALKEIGQKYNYEFHSGNPIKQQIMILCDKLFGCCDAENSKGITVKYDRDRDERYKYNSLPKTFFDNLIGIESKDMTLYIPLFYSTLLTNEFKEYVNPCRGSSDHDYPLYIKQEEVMKKSDTDHLFWRPYTCRKDDMLSHGVHSKEHDQEVVFLISRAENWVFFENEYKKYNNNPLCTCYIIPIPYYKKDNLLNHTEIVFEAEDFPDDVKITKPDEYDFYGRKPDIVYYDDPYDNFDAYTSVYPMFYSDKIRLFAGKMIYVSCILVDEYDKDDVCATQMMKHCILTPGVARADEVIVQSEKIRQRYIEALTEWAGEDTKPVWEKRIKGSGTDRVDIKEYPDISPDELNNDWINYLYKPDGTRKEVVLFHIEISNLAQNGVAVINRIKEVFDDFKDDPDRILYFNPDPRINESLKDYNEEQWNSYTEIVNRFIEDDYGIYDDGEDDYFMVCLCDRFIGDAGKVMYHCIRAGKPVEIME